MKFCPTYPLVTLQTRRGNSWLNLGAACTRRLCPCNFLSLLPRVLARHLPNSRSRASPGCLSRWLGRAGTRWGVTSARAPPPRAPRRRGPTSPSSTSLRSASTAPSAASMHSAPSSSARPRTRSSSCPAARPARRYPSGAARRKGRCRRPLPALARGVAPGAASWAAESRRRSDSGQGGCRRGRSR